MIVTLQNVISYATTFAGGGTDWATSEVSFYANLAAQEIANQVWHQPYEALAYSSTTSGENRISLPSDFDSPIALSNLSSQGVTGGRQLRMEAGEWISSQATVDYAEPEVYALYSTWMELYPTPDSAYSLELRYRARQATLVDSSSTPTFDERWHPAWLHKTSEILCASRGNPEGEALARNRYQSYMGSIKDDRTLRQQAKAGKRLQYLREEM